ncbi:MAG: methyltransferase domain-containing protein [Candidatus Hydrogenedentes bacterium]|nr:methyltransferase domain-containing protein [Candidatus Hydrogenedentota bacterium]
MAQPRILTFNFHEPYLCLMAKTGLPLEIGLYNEPPLARAWQTQFRPVPPNLSFVEERIWRRDLEAGAYDVVVAQNETNAANIFRACQCPALLVCHNRRTFLETTIHTESGSGPESYARLLERLRDKFAFIFISESKQKDYEIPGTVIRPGIDVEEFGGYTGEVAEILRVGNMMRDRNRMFDVDFQEEVCAGFPNRVVGSDPQIPEARPSESFEQLVDTYRRLRCLLHVTREEYEDGYNLSTLEAMACGMPVISLANPTSPITDGVDGYAAYDAAVLRAHIQELLDDRDLACAIGARGRETVARAFPIEAFVERWREALLTAAERGTGSPGARSRAAAASGEDMSGIPRLRILLDGAAPLSEPAAAIAAALDEAHEVRIVCRGQGSDDSSVPVAPDAAYGDVLEALGGFRPELYIRVDPAAGQVAPDMDRLNCPTVCCFTESPARTADAAAVACRFNFTFHPVRAQVDVLAGAGVPNVGWMPSAASLPLPAGTGSRAIDVVCVGEPAATASLERAIAGQLPGRGLRACPAEQAAEDYSNAKIVVFAGDNGGLPRGLFDAMAAGALAVAPDSDELRALFDPGAHLVAYGDEDEACQAVARYVNDEGARERMAAAGAELVAAKHTYPARAKQVILMVLDALGMLSGLTGESRFRTGGYYRAPRPEVAAHVPRNARRVLDCGCGAGEFGRSLKERGAREVVGIEIVERACAMARQVLDDAIQGNIEEMELPFDDEHFDCIVFGDVLEHLIDPLAVLRKCSRVLAPGGVIVMSIPNARFWQVVEMLANGRWKYEDAGILDRTHLRFFTAVEMHHMVRDAGLEVLRLQPLSVWEADRLPRNPDGSLTIGRVTVAGVSDAEYRDFLTYQYLIVAGKPNADRLAPARRALDEGDFQGAYQRAEQAVGAGECEQKALMAKASARLGMLDRAESLYRAALALRPDDHALAGELGTVLVAMNRLGEAVPLLEQAVAADSGNHRALGALGLALLAGGDAGQAFPHLLRSLDIHFDNEALMLKLIDAAEPLGRLREIVEVVRRFVDYHPGNVEMALRFSRMLIELGNLAEARDRLDTLLLLSPDHGEARALLDSLRGDQS